MKSLEGLVEIKNDPRILFVRVIGNGGHSGYSLPSYNKEMGKHMIWLAERGIQGVCSTMLATVGKYDNFHLHDHQFNRKLVYRFLRGAIAFHLKYIEVMTKKDELRDYAARNDQDRLAAVCLFPTMVQFRLALSRTQEVMQAFTPEQKTATPAQVFDQADEEILMRVHAGILEVQEEATQEGRPKPTDFLQGHSPTKSRTQLTMESKRFGHMIFSRPNGFHASFHAKNWYNLCFHAASHCGLLRCYRAIFLTRSLSLLQGQRMSHLFHAIAYFSQWLQFAAGIHA